MQETNTAPSREKLLHALYEAAELEHNLMCTYLYATFSLRDGESEGLSAHEAEVVARWRRTILDVAIDEMRHLTAVWNITSAIGGSPRFGRGNFPLDPGVLPAGIVVKLAPFNEHVLQHFVYLERPEGSPEQDGEGFSPELRFSRATSKVRLTPMGMDYATVGAFYTMLGNSLQQFVDHLGEESAFCGDPSMQQSPAEVSLDWPKPVQCLKTALAAFTVIVRQGEGAPEDTADSHFNKFIEIRTELAALKAANPDFQPSWPAAVNPVLRTPMRSTGRVWIEDENAAETVDLANSAYALMLRLMAYSYVVPRPLSEKSLVIDLAQGLMRAVTYLAERAARLPAGPSNPGCNAGMSFVSLRDAAPFQPGPAARRFFVERLGELAEAATVLDDGTDQRLTTASRQLSDLARRGERGFDAAATELARAAPMPSAETPEPIAKSAIPIRSVTVGVETVSGDHVSVLYEAKKCIWAHFCVGGGPAAFLGENSENGWIFPDQMNADDLVAVVRQCPSGALQYRRHDGKPDEAAPPINQIALREAGPYAVRGDIRLDGQSINYRAALCRCGASKNKPFCDASHLEVGFSATGEPPTGQVDMLAVRDGPLDVEPETNGPLQVRGNLEIVSGTGRAVARVLQARLCRCGASNNKPFCDGSHQRIGFKST